MAGGALAALPVLLLVLEVRRKLAPRLGLLDRPATTTPTSKAGPSAAAFDEWEEKFRRRGAELIAEMELRLPELERKAHLERDAMSHGSPASPSRIATLASSRSLGQSTLDMLSHVVSCSWCQASPGLLRSLSRTLARDADGLEASTSASEATSSSAAPEPESATSGSNQCLETLGLRDGKPQRCVRERGHTGWHAVQPEAAKLAELLS
jgi:hypothetical protein